MGDPAQMFAPFAPDESSSAKQIDADGLRVIAPVPDDAPREYPRHRLGKPTAVWEYRDGGGRLKSVVARFDTATGKEVLPLTYCEAVDGSKSWRWKSPPAPRPLFGLDRLSAAPDAPVVIVEGEKSAEAAALLLPDSVVTTSQGGSKAAGKTDWSALKGRDVVIWPDADNPGQKYARDVARLVQRARVVSPPDGVKEGWDAADAADEGWTTEQALALVAAAKEPEDVSIGPRAEVRCVADVEMKPVRWLWPSRIARGKLTLIAGHPGLGKSQVTAALAATVTTGGRWPVDDSACEMGSVLILSAEDDVADTIRPRLEAAGADTRRVYTLDAIRTPEGERRGFDIVKDMGRLGELLELYADISLVVIDPISAYLGQTDSHRNSEVRAALSPVSELAARYEVAIVAVSHLNKSGGGDAMGRVIGSVAFTAAVRAAYLIAKDESDPARRLFLPLKNNLGNDRTGFAFRIEDATVSGISTSRVIWEAEPVEKSADEALAGSGDPSERTALTEACEFLEDLLAEGPVSAKAVKAEARDAGVAEKTLQRAKTKLGVETSKEGLKGGWVWRLPPKVAKPSEDGQAKGMATFEDGRPLRRWPSKTDGHLREPQAWEEEF